MRNLRQLISICLPSWLCLFACLLCISGCGTAPAPSAKNPVLQEIAITPLQVTVALGQKIQLKAVGHYSDGSEKDITASSKWTTDNPAAISIAPSGLASCLAAGQSIIYASYLSVKGASMLTVTKAQLVSIAITPATSTLPLGTSQQLGAVGTFTDDSTSDLTSSVQWTSAQPGVAAVSPSGLVASKAMGTASVSAAMSGVSASTQLTVAQHALVSIAVNAGSPGIALGTITQFNATGTYTDGATQDITSSVAWSAAPGGILQIGSSGSAKGVKTGQAVVSAVSGPVSGNGTMAVTAAQLVSLAINIPSSALALGTSQQLTATATLTDNSTADVTNSVNWTSTQPGVAIVSPSGLVTSKATGTASLSATQGTVSATVQLAVSQHTLVSIAVSASSLNVALGASSQLSAKGTYTDGATQDITSSVTWSAAPEGILQISSSGVAKSIKTGSVMVSAVAGSVSATGTVTVSKAQLVSLSITPASAALALGKSQQLKAIGTFTDASTADLSSSAQWTSARPGVATVSSSGLVLSKATGTASVVATVGGITASAQVAVAQHSLVSIAVKSSNQIVALGTSSQFIANGTYTDGAVEDITTAVTWSAAPAGILQISNSGNAKSVKTGNVVASAVLGPVSGSAKLVVSAAQLIAVNIVASSQTMPLGTTQQLTAIGTYTDGSSSPLGAGIVWSSGAAKTISVDAGGLATANARGVAAVSAVVSGVAGSQPLTVSDPVLQSISVSPASPSISISQSVQLAASGLFTDGSTQDFTQSAAWLADEPQIVAVSAAGTAIALGVGSTTVHANVGAVTGSAVVTVQAVAATGYFVNDATDDATFRMDNPGVSGQNLCAMVYVFDQDQQMAECCGCQLSQDGLRTLSLKSDLVKNPLIDTAPASGTVLLVTASVPDSGTCDASSMTPNGLALSWISRVHAPSQGAPSSTEEPLSPMPLSTTLSSALQAQCSFIQQLGSGRGICSCGKEK